MQLHVIHLEHRTDRLVELKSQLAGQKIDEYTVWSGIPDPEKPSRGIAHQRIVNWAVSLDKIMIAEDDMVFTAANAFNHFLPCEPEHYDLYLGGISYGKIKMDNSVEAFAGTHLYIIKQPFYKTFLSVSGDIDIDRDLSGKGKFQVCNPMVAIQSDGYSDNKKEYRENSIYFKNKNLWTGAEGNQWRP